MTAHKNLQSLESIQSSLIPLLRTVVNKLAYFGFHCPWLAGIVNAPPIKQRITLG